MTLHAITVLGHDRPGIIAQSTAILGSLGLNLEDSTMTLLRGRFAMVLISEGAVDTAAIEAALAPLGVSGDLTVAVRELPDEEQVRRETTSWILTVHGGDRPGIVSSVVAQVAAVGGNITDLTTRLSGELYLLVAEVELPVGVDVDAVRAALDATADGLGVGATLSPVEADEL
ncbi:glycine cleavage system protein R [Nocardioides alcanivorans]|uniref:glycine cleavage system protein R n=1 Tax=Nocardioides alcanivorans TaxID=2897352 RepID=UPI001F3DC1D1|nr:ACT domain-containing protein [Nocardioides alcanivorans]